MTKAKRLFFYLALPAVLLWVRFTLSGAPEGATQDKTARPDATASAQTSVPKVEIDQTLLEKHSRVPAPQVPGAYDGDIARFMAQLLQRSHFSRKEFDDNVSSRFLDRYLKRLDPQRLHFIQSDIEDFEKYRNRLDDLILKENDTSVAYKIFSRFRERLDQRVQYARELLKSEPLEFTGDERIALNRRELPYPKDLGEAKKLWRERLRFELLQEKLNGEKPEEILSIINRRYDRLERSFNEWDAEDTLESFLTSLAHVYDPHSDFFGRAQLENFAIGMNLELFGIGAVLMSEDGYCKIKELVPGGPAAKSKKIKENDRIVAVAQGDSDPVDIVDMKLSKAVDLIRGPKGTEVRLTIIPAAAGDSSAREIVSLVRDRIKLEDQEAKAKLIELPCEQGEPVRIGVIGLPSFYSNFDVLGKEKSEPKSTTLDVAKLLTKLKREKVSGVILDLRRNGGGSLEEAINLTGLFIKEGPVVQVRDTYGPPIIDFDTDPSVLYDGPLVILTSRFSASASEILAGALQDYGRAVVVGDSSTHGKGTVQALYQLGPSMKHAGINLTNNPGALKVTIRKFYRASGSSTQLKGVEPDIVLPSVNNEAEVGESSLDNPLPWDDVPAGNFEKLNRVKPYLGDLRERSTARISTDKEFAYVREDIEIYKKFQADKTVSLNEKERLKEKEENEARKEAREAERKARPAPAEKVYEITLKQAALPGLPELVDASKASAKSSEDSDTEKNGYNEPADDGKPAGKSKGEAKAGDTDAEKNEDEEEDHPGVDVHLEEAKRILVDYISLLPRQTVVTAGPADKSKTP